MTKFDEIIYEIAADNYGLITSAEAREAGVSNMELVQYAKRGRLERIGQGLYRLAQRIPEANDPYAVAVALVGPGAYLYGEGVLGMLGLCPTNPAYVPIATTHRIRRRLPSYIRIKKTDGNESVSSYDGIPAQEVFDAIRSCMTTMLPDRLIAATETAFSQGYIDKEQKEELLASLEVLA